MVWWSPGLLLALLVGSSWGKLEVGFYRKSCPGAEEIVRSVVGEAAASDPTTAAALLRLHFHDCIIQGCEGSVLIFRPDGKQENMAFGNEGLRGFDAACPGVVSCSDILSLAARDSILLSNGPRYDVPTGRRDGRVSNISDGDNLPDVNDSAAVLRAKFAQKGLSDRDLVLLSAAHTIGTAACFFMNDRLYNFRGSGAPDPSISFLFLPALMATCPRGGDPDARLPIDGSAASEFTFDDHILWNIAGGAAVLQSDAALYGDPSTRAIIDSYLRHRGFAVDGGFAGDFAAAMVRMGQIGALTGSQGEIRRICSSFN
ncbi:unnamed protein product [Spirodela intermedia]|uniref:Peroxidase n=1 Tax=Spirodela intermedia TaxID=51605 RepID=A0A7I8J1E7_SPIIN|nr:unnamed protein product [Spirodela intermedia]CAA6663879.1 unnamed protein product [Spirodela intermedia]